MCDMKTRRYAHIIPVLRIAVWYIDDDNVNSVVLLLCWTLGNTVVLRVGQLALVSTCRGQITAVC